MTAINMLLIQLQIHRVSRSHRTRHPRGETDYKGVEIVTGRHTFERKRNNACIAPGRSGFGEMGIWRQAGKNDACQKRRKREVELHGGK
jgi:hypothetical protein